jgi:hypothetical protein
MRRFFSCCRKKKSFDKEPPITLIDNTVYPTDIECIEVRYNEAELTMTRQHFFADDDDNASHGEPEVDYVYEQFATCFDEDKPEGILAIDADDTLLISRLNRYDRNLRLIEPERISELIALAAQHRVMVGIVTARKYVEAEKEGIHPLSIVNIMRQLGRHHFSFVAFTNETLKDDVLNFIYEKFLQNHTNASRVNLCLVDDSMEQLTVCRAAGFKGIQVTADNNYLTQMETFIRSFPCQLAPDLEIVVETARPFRRAGCG